MRAPVQLAATLLLLPGGVVLDQRPADPAATGLDTYSSDVRVHLRDATELELADPATAFAALEQWLETLGGANPIARRHRDQASAGLRPPLSAVSLEQVPRAAARA